MLNVRWINRFSNPMLPIRELLAGPESFEFLRNEKTIVATRRELTSQPVTLSRVTIADAMAPEEFAPIKIARSEYRCFVYEWHHPRGVINVCALITPTVHAAIGRLVELPIKQSFAPHVPGIPVDSGEIVIQLSKSALPSGSCP